MVLACDGLLPAGQRRIGLEQSSLSALVLQADNDPWVPQDAARAARLAAGTSLIITRGGGHVGFADGQPQPWFVRCAASWSNHLLA